MLKKTLLVLAWISLLFTFWPAYAADAPAQRLGTGVATAIAAAPNGRVVAVGSSIGVWFFTADLQTTLGFWDTGAWVERVQYSADGRFVRANDLYWDTSLARAVPLVPAETAWLEHQCSPSGKYCARLSGGSSAAIVKDQDTLIDVALVSVGIAHDVAWSADNQTLYTVGEHLRAWAIPTGTLTADKTSFFNGSLYGTAWSPDGQIVVDLDHAWQADTAQPAVAAPCPFISWSIWARLPYQCDATFERDYWGAGITVYANPAGAVWHWIEPHTLRTNAADLSADRRWLLTSGADDFAYDCPAFDGRRGKDGQCHRTISYTRVWNADGFDLLAQIEAEFCQVALIPNSQQFVGRRTDSLELWDWSSGQRLWSVAAASSGLAMSPTGEYFATSYGMTVSVWRTATGEKVADLTGHTVPTYEGWQNVNTYGHRWPFGVSAISGLAFSPDGTRLAASGEDGTILIWPVP